MDDILPTFDIETTHAQLRCHGSRNPMQASRVDVHTRDGRGFFVGRFGAVPHASGRRWHYPEPGGGESDVGPDWRAWLRRELAAHPETAALAETVPA